MSFLNNEYPVTGNDFLFLKEILSQIVKSSESIGFEFIVIGATARDFLFNYVYKTNLMLRATNDLDLAILIDTWDGYDNIVNELVSNYGFSKTKMKQRLLFGKMPLDIIPFGDIEENGSIYWTPERTIKMSVKGFREVFDSGIHLRFDDIVFRILSLQGLFITKLIAWNERKIVKKTDAEDIDTIIFNYNEFYPNDLYENYSHLIKSADYDYRLAGVTIFGSRLNSFLRNYPDLHSEIISILSGEISESSELVLAMNNIASYDMNLKALKILRDELLKQ